MMNGEVLELVHERRVERVEEDAVSKNGINIG